jgi:hypothetical protein
MRVSVCSFLMIRTASQCGQRTAGDGGGGWRHDGYRAEAYQGLVWTLLDSLPRTETGGVKRPRYCPKCWTAFSADGVLWNLGLIRFGGRVPKGGYDVQNGIKQSRKTRAPTVHGGVQDRRSPARLCRSGERCTVRVHAFLRPPPPRWAFSSPGPCPHQGSFPKKSGCLDHIPLRSAPVPTKKSICFHSASSAP